MIDFEGRSSYELKVHLRASGSTFTLNQHHHKYDSSCRLCRLNTAGLIDILLIPSLSKYTMSVKENWKRAVSHWRTSAVCSDVASLCTTISLDISRNHQRQNIDHHGILTPNSIPTFQVKPSNRLKGYMKLTVGNNPQLRATFTVTQCGYHRPKTQPPIVCNTSNRIDTLSACHIFLVTFHLPNFGRSIPVPHAPRYCIRWS